MSAQEGSFELLRLWRKSTKSGSGGCVEVALGTKVASCDA